MMVLATLVLLLVLTAVMARWSSARRHRPKAGYKVTLQHDPHGSSWDYNKPWRWTAHIYDSSGHQVTNIGAATRWGARRLARLEVKRRAVEPKRTEEYTL